MTHSKLGSDFNNKEASNHERPPNFTLKSSAIFVWPWFDVVPEVPKRESTMIELFKKHQYKREKPPYLERIDELEKVSIVRLKGRIDQAMIPVVESRIQENRRMGSKIDKNVLLDFSKVEHVDSATIAFQIIRLREYQAKGFKTGFINITNEMKALLDIFKETDEFKIYSSEEEAVRELSK